MRFAVFGGFVAAIALTVTLACGGSTEDTVSMPYTYPGCDASTALCNGQLAFSCALDTISAKHSRCASRSDCVAASGLDPTSCLSFCEHSAINRQEQQAYLEEIKVEMNRFCSQSSCLTYVNCPAPKNAILDCVDAGCVWVEGVLRVDGGLGKGSGALTARPEDGGTDPADGAVPGDGSVPQDAGGARDSGTGPDAAMPRDASVAPDAAVARDASIPQDAGGTQDAGTGPDDAATAPDAAVARDASIP